MDVGNFACDKHVVDCFGKKQSGQFTFSREMEKLSITCNGPKSVVSELLFYTKFPETIILNKSKEV